MTPNTGRIEIVTKTTGAIVTLDEIKAFLLLDGTSVDDTLLTTMEVAARDKGEAYMRRPLLPQTSRLWYDDGVSGTVQFPFGKLISVDNVLTYDEDGSATLTDTADYIVDLTSDQQGRVSFLYAQYGYRIINDTSIEFENGYADADSVPQIIKDGILSLISYWYENREMYGSSALSSGVKNKWNPYRVVRI